MTTKSPSDGGPPLPPSTAVVPNIPLCDQTLEQLRLERTYWDHKVETAPGFASAKAADDFRRGCDAWIARREREAGL